MTDVIFSETQRFKQWWLWLLLFALDAKLLFGVFKQVFHKQHLSHKPIDYKELLITTSIVLIVTLLFLSLKLETKINKYGIYVRYFPFHMNFKYYSWNVLPKFYIRTYAPILEYGGWGLRLGLFGKGSAYNVSGNNGLQLEFANGDKLLIGTNKPDALAIALEKLTTTKNLVLSINK